jgi:hypothetical protein
MDPCDFLRLFAGELTNKPGLILVKGFVFYDGNLKIRLKVPRSDLDARRD